MKIIPILILLIMLTTFPLTSAAHWIAGYVENATDSTSPDGRTVRLWNPLNADEIFGIVGPSGLSGTHNVYMIDCETLATPCQVGDKLNLTLVNDFSGYTAKNIVEVTTSGSGFDVAPNLTMNTPFILLNVTIEDSLTFPENEIDLTPAGTTLVTCSGVAQGKEDASGINFSSAEIFSSTSTYESPDDKNTHYTNSSCQINTSYGTSVEALINCTFKVEYYANADTWTCRINTTNNESVSAIGTDTTTMNSLLAIGVDSPLDFGVLDPKTVSAEKTAQVTNYGNVKINLTLSGYGESIGDNNAMICNGRNISIDYMKYNLTTSNSGDINSQEFDSTYENLTSTPTRKEFNLNSRQDDVSNDAINDTYWRVYVPQEINSNCTGNIVFGATQS